MPLGTLDRTPPPFFRQGPSALTKLVVFSALAVFLMVADARLNVVLPLRSVIASMLYPLQWITRLPGDWAGSLSRHFESLQQAQSTVERGPGLLKQQALRAQQVEQLQIENDRLRQLLSLREQTSVPAQAAQVLYDAADPYTRKIVIDKGSLKGILPGSPVIDELGVLGQVTRVYPLVSEVTLLTDAEQVIPTLNTRNGARALAFGSSTSQGDGMELRLMAANADVQAGDLLVTSGVDAVYPPGLQVAQVSKVDRRVDSVFASIALVPVARIGAALHVLVLQPLSAHLPPRPQAEGAIGATAGPAGDHK
ncbi:MAG: rod shape-determining protein MreC [Hylemonella sp.]